MASRRGAAALAVAATVLLAGCSSGEQTVEGPVTVYVSLPLSGPRAADGQDAADGARLALEQAGGRAGELEVRAEFLDDAGEGVAWDPVKVGENARAAAQDSSTAAYIGELDSEPTRASLPITNEAGIVQISPGAGGVDLTRPARGYPDSPDRYRPSGDTTFVRLAAPDDAVARAAVELAARDASSIRIDSDDSLYGRLVTSEITREAEGSGLDVRGEGGDAVLEPDGSILVTGPRVEPVVIAGLLAPPSLADEAFSRDFAAAFGRAPGPYAAYGFEAMLLALEGIEGAEGEGEFRPAVRDAIFGAERKGSLLGPYTVGDEGDTDLCSVQVYGAGPDGATLNPIDPIETLCVG